MSSSKPPVGPIATPKIPIDQDQAKALSDYDALGNKEDATLARLCDLAKSISGVTFALVVRATVKNCSFLAGPGNFPKSWSHEAAPTSMVLANGEYYRSVQISEEWPAFGDLILSFDEKIKSFHGFPLLASNGQTVGVLVLLDATRRALSEKKVTELQQLSNVAMDLLNFKLEEKNKAGSLVERIGANEKAPYVTFDALTGLLKRDAFLSNVEREINRSQRHGRIVSLLIVDIDGLKRINQQYGQAVGDTTLVRFAEACGKTFRDEDLVGRLGDDEFGILMAETDSEGALIALERLREELGKSAIFHANLNVSISAGVADGFFHGWDGAQDLLLRASGALEMAKTQGRNRDAISQAA